jgi:hypothetical protein
MRAEHLETESKRAVRMLRKALSDREKAQKRVTRWRARCDYLCRNGAAWKRSWFKWFVPPGLGD